MNKKTNDIHNDIHDKTPKNKNVLKENSENKKNKDTSLDSTPIKKEPIKPPPTITITVMPNPNETLTIPLASPKKTPPFKE